MSDCDDGSDEVIEMCCLEENLNDVWTAEFCEGALGCAEDQW